ncbi:urotensin-2 receptor [Callorhinchus milii]|uniref:urotensin-2 receptor n=1 Tax=Callorhinchus milii TaxID=7868 RepID=UPI0004572FA2|nr:urotensin-2 receptor [Callorhinchus milii]|eukprot:gi/632943687/ref/XP_007887083.1/ PREDICTED: urotensin-2 receptor [Callorhinchus milii]
MATGVALMGTNSSSNTINNDSLTELTTGGRSVDELLVTYAIGTVLSAMLVTGVTGNVHTLVMMCHSMRSTASMYVYITSLALADLLYLCTIPFVVCTYFAKGWYFGDLGCRLLFSVDLLTMHASIFTLTVMSTERYLAVVRPLDTVKRPKGYRKAIAGLLWLCSLLLATPMIIIIKLQRVQDKIICLPAWSLENNKIYLSVLFSTSILAPGIVIGYLYIRLARTYWVSQATALNNNQTKRSPNHKVLYMIFTIVLVFWACFLPFWVWQLIQLYHPPLSMSQRTQGHINYLMTCLTYSNSCINPFLYTLLTKNYKEYLKNRQRGVAIGGSFHPRNQRLHHTSRRSLSRTESMTLSHIPRTDSV